MLDVFIGSSTQRLDTKLCFDDRKEANITIFRQLNISTTKMSWQLTCNNLNYDFFIIKAYLVFEALRQCMLR